jgi:hypothetical protein
MDNFRQIKLFIALIGVLFLFACVTTGSSGSRLVADAGKIDKLLLVGNDKADFGSRSMANPSLAKLWAEMDQRLAKVFVANGLNSDFRLLTKQTSLIAGPDVSHVISITPANAQFATGGGDMRLEFKVTLTHMASRNSVWAGIVSVREMGYLSTQSRADSFASALLTQLKKDGIIGFSTAEPVVPKE